MAGVVFTTLITRNAGWKCQSRCCRTWRPRYMPVFRSIWCRRTGSPELESSDQFTVHSASCERRMLRFDFEVFFFGTAILIIPAKASKRVCLITEFPSFRKQNLYFFLSLSNFQFLRAAKGLGRVPAAPPAAPSFTSATGVKTAPSAWG